MLERQVPCYILSMCHSLYSYFAMPVKLILGSIYTMYNYLSGRGRGGGQKCAVKLNFRILSQLHFMEPNYSLSCS